MKTGWPWILARIAMSIKRLESLVSELESAELSPVTRRMMMTKMLKKGNLMRD